MSAKGLEWALRLRTDLHSRIEQLREALAGIEPLRQELARLEEQLKGVERLVAAYHEQLGYPKANDVAAPVAQPALTRAELTRQLEAALIPLEALEPETLVQMETRASPTLVAILRGEALRAVVVVRNGAAHTTRTATRLWLSLRVWLAERFPHSNTLS
jgi:hypothetical protein